MRQIQTLRRNVLTRDSARLFVELAEKDLQWAPPGQPPPILYKARIICRGLTPHHPIAQALALLFWVRQHVPYINDPLGMEFVIAPVELLRQIDQHGSFPEDCDSQSMLLYALLRAIGHRPAFVCVGYSDDPKIDHVFVSDQIHDTSFALDPILPPWQVAQALNIAKWSETFSVY